MAKVIRSAMLVAVAVAMTANLEAGQQKKKWQQQQQQQYPTQKQQYTQKLTTQEVPVPRIGFSSYFDGQGEQVTSVRSGSLAARIGLEPGDVILAVNGQRLTYDGAWYRLMSGAAKRGNLTLAIRDWRTGRIAYRYVNLGGPTPTMKSPGR